MRFELNTPLPNDWEYKSIESVCKQVTSGGTPSRKHKEEFYDGGHICWVKTQELNDAFIYNTEEKITELALLNSSAKMLPKNTVLMAMYGATVGKLGILAEEMTCNQASCALVVDENKAHYKYLYYILLNHRELIKSLAIGAAQQNLSGARIKSFEFPLPPLNVQHEIADFLGLIDKKIILNQQINETLEAMTQAIFKSWFIDFDPVKAKMEILGSGGTEEEANLAAMRVISSKTADELAAFKAVNPERYAELHSISKLFPCEMKEGAKGFPATPLGWPVAEMKELIKRGGSALKDEVAPVYSVTKEEGLVPSEEYFTKDVSSKNKSKYRIVNPLDIAYNPSRINIGSIGINRNNFKVAVSPIYVVSQPKSKEYADFIMQLLNLSFIKKQIVQLSSGSVRQSLNFNDFGMIKFVRPNDELVKKFSAFVEKNMDIANSLVTQNQTLEELRDTLLPRLLSGQIELPLDERHYIEEVG